MLLVNRCPSKLSDQFLISVSLHFNLSLPAISISRKDHNLK